MKRIFTGLLALGAAALSAPVAAEPSSNVAWTSELRAQLLAGDAAVGEALYVRENCAKCHGDNGVAEKELYPNLGGLPLAYVYKQLRDYKDDKRENRRMGRAVRDLTEQDFVNLAAWIASLPPTPARVPDAAVPVAGGDMSAATELVRRGDGARLIPACNVCHGIAARRTPSNMPVGAPSLDGQQAEYFIETMLAYKNGDRANDVYGVMRWIAAALTETEIEQLGVWYAGRGMPEQQATVGP